MYCIKCGNKLSKKDKFCGNCGYNLNQEEVKKQASSGPSNGLENVDKKLLFGVVGFIAPIAGIVLYFASKDNEPEEAKSALTWALIAIPLHIIGAIIYFILQVITYLI